MDDPTYASIISPVSRRPFDDCTGSTKPQRCPKYLAMLWPGYWLLNHSVRAYGKRCSTHGERWYFAPGAFRGKRRRRSWL